MFEILLLVLQCLRENIAIAFKEYAKNGARSNKMFICAVLFVLLEC